MNPARIEEILSSMSGRKIRVEENVAPYTFRVYVENGEGFVDYDAIVRKLKKVKPSHLAFEVCFEVFTTAYIGTSYHGTAQRVSARITGTLRPRELLSTTYAKAGLWGVRQQEPPGSSAPCGQKTTRPPHTPRRAVLRTVCRWQPASRAIFAR